MIKNLRHFVRRIFAIIVFSACSFMTAQVGINTTNPDPSSVLDVKSSNKGLLLPRINLTSDINNPAEGLMIYEITSKCFKGFQNGNWTGCFFPNPGTITSIDCTGATHIGTLTEGQSATGASTNVNYTGGNGGSYPTQTIPSTGVTGLTASINSGVFNTGNGTLIYTISGTPQSNGIATFSFTIGGRSCTFSRNVVSGVGTISTIDCSAATNSGTLTGGVAASGVSSSIPYTGGNGGTHTGQSVTSTGVTGLTATLTSGSFANGNGTLTYTITGTPSGTGSAFFAINIGGRTCTLNRTVAAGVIASIDCAAATNSGTLVSNVAASGVSSSIPYTGGNGGPHNGQTVTSTGVTGLTATLTSGTFANGNGTLTYTITGTPSGTGSAFFAINIGGRTCTLTRTVNGGSIASIDCTAATNSGTLVGNVAASGVSSSIPYTGGNGGPHSGQSVTSTGVIGLTATLTAGTFANGNGTLTYTISGTPSGTGTASFAINIGGRTCTLNRTVAAGVIASIDCAAATNSGTLTGSIPASGVSSSIPYTGGNGGPHSGQTITSTGVTGLTATLTSGTFANGNGTLTYTISGTPSGGGTASFAINIGGRTCTLNRTVATPFTPPTTLGNASFTGNLCFDVVETNDGGNCGTKSSRISQRTDFTTSARVVQYTFRSTTTVSNLRFRFIDSAGNAIDSFTGDVAGTVNANTNYVGTVTYKNNLNTTAAGLTNDNPIIPELYAVYTEGGVDKYVRLLPQIKDCACCGAFGPAGTFLTLKCFNEGATETGDYLTPGWQTNGAYYQWGRKAIGGPAPTATNLNNGPVSGWNSTPVTSPTAWNSGTVTNPVKTANDPCPSGWRVPTRPEYQAIVDNNKTNLQAIGTWNNGSSDTYAARKIGNYTILPAAGSRGNPNGVINLRGHIGFYWTSELVEGAGDPVNARGAHIYFRETGDFIMEGAGSGTASAMSVRCIKQ